MSERLSAERLAEIGTENTPEGRLDLIRQFQSEFPPDVQGYSFLIPEGARGVSLEDYRAAVLGAIPLLLYRITAIRLSLDAVTRERDELREQLKRATSGGEGRVPHQTASNE